MIPPVRRDSEMSLCAHGQAVNVDFQSLRTQHLEFRHDILTLYEMSL